MMHDPHERARKYPYHIPERSYIMDNGVHTIIDHENILADLSERKPILAVGSNLSPQQLARKFPGPENSLIPVTKIKLRHFDSVYSTHFTKYGAIPATLFPSPDTEVSLFINWLDEAQLENMHETEIPNENYHFCRLNNIKAEIQNGPELDHVFVYLSTRGALSVDGKPVPLAAITAQNRRWEAMHQYEIQDHARLSMAPETSLPDFINENITSIKHRQKRTDILHSRVIAFRHDNVDVIEI